MLAIIVFVVVFPLLPVTAMTFKLSFLERKNLT